MPVNWKLFREQLLSWYQPNRRPMPWKGERDPYLIWLSEIILQQTRVEQGWKYFERFKAAYPRVEDLAAAPDDEVMKNWEGLGYYSRARNLLKAARMVVTEYNGRFPDTHSGLLSLPGVGPYTAAAIGSFAFDLPLAVVDGNVYRILSRYAKDDTPIDTPAGKKHFAAMANSAFSGAESAIYNQAIMDFGALVCRPKRADCISCPLAENCSARKNDLVYELPVKAKRIKRRTRFFHFLLIEDDSGKVMIQQRTGKDIWQNLFQFPLVETNSDRHFRQLMLAEEWPDWLVEEGLEWLGSSPPKRQQLTHQEIIGRFHRIRVPNLPLPGEEYKNVDVAGLSGFAFPKIITGFLAEKNLYLDLF